MIGCGGTLTSPEGSIISPGYPASYGENAECIWKIEVSHGSRVLFAFVDLDMESQSQGCEYDYVEVMTFHSIESVTFLFTEIVLSLGTQRKRPSRTIDWSLLQQFLTCSDCQQVDEPLH